MAYSDYFSTVKQAVTGATVPILSWNYILAVSAFLHANGYVTRGSSRNGSAGAAYSATPDGVDHWIGRTQPQAAGIGAPIWHVYQHSVTGHQVCLHLGTTSGPVSVIEVTFALNKFEVGGVWRGGGTATNVRPTDVTSSPTAKREINAGTGSLTPQSLSNQFYGVWVRKDGRGFYSALWRTVTPSSSDGFNMGYFPLTEPAATDLNPYLAFVGNNVTMGSGTLPYATASGGIMMGRLADGTLQEHRCIDIDTGSAWLNRLDPWRVAYPMYRIAVRSITTKDVRYWMPDIHVCSGTLPASSDFATRNGKTSFKLNPTGAFGLIWPWDGVTVSGTDVATYVFPECPPPPPAPVFAPNPPAVPRTFVAPLINSVPVAPGLELGVDAACVTDVTSTFALVSGLENLGQALARRLITPRDGLFYDPDYGLDLRGYLNAGVTDAQMATLPDEIRLELEKDERLQSCTVELEFSGGTTAKTMRVTIRGVAAPGPFTLILAVSAVTIEILGLQSSAATAG